MHIRSINARNQAARESIRAAASALSDVLGVEPLVPLTSLELRDGAVAQMRELETIADLLRAVVLTINDSGIHTEIYYDCPDCSITTVLAPGVVACSGCGKPLELIQIQ